MLLKCKRIRYYSMDLASYMSISIKHTEAKEDNKQRNNHKLKKVAQCNISLQVAMNKACQSTARIEAVKPTYLALAPQTL